MNIRCLPIQSTTASEHKFVDRGYDDGIYGKIINHIFVERIDNFMVGIILYNENHFEIIMQIFIVSFYNMNSTHHKTLRTDY